MVSAIFQPEISNLESQISQMQAQIDAAQERIKALFEVESLSDGALQSLETALQKVSALAPSALANLKSAVLDLFRGDNQPGSDDDNQPIDPEPQPDNGGGAVVVDFEPLKYLNTSCPVYFDHYWETAEPDSSSWEIASPLACQLEDCPESALTGQAVEITCDREDRKELFIELVKVTDTVAYQRRYDGEIICVYAGGSNKGKLKNWGDWLTRTHSVTHGYQLRAGERLSTKWELKLTPMTLTQIERLATCDFSLDPSSAYPDAPVRPPARFTVRACEIDDFSVGDHVRSTTIKSWEYVVTALREDGCLDCRRLNVTSTIDLALHPASLEKVEKEVVAVETPEQQFAYSVLKTDNHLGQKLSVSRSTSEGKQQFLGSVSCGSNAQRWSHSRQPKLGQNIPFYPSREAAATALAEAYERDTAPRLAVAAGLEPDF